MEAIFSSRLVFSIIVFDTGLYKINTIIIDKIYAIILYNTEVKPFLYPIYDTETIIEAISISTKIPPIFFLLL